jgi:Glycosyltransferase family 87
MRWWNLTSITVLVWTVLATLAVGRAAFYASPRHQGCYPVFAGAARHWLAGEDLYDSVNSNSLDVFRYAPVAAVLLTPLGGLSDAWGSAALRGAGLALFLPALWYWCSLAFPRAFTRREIWKCFLLVAALCSSSLMDVQFNIITIGLMLLSMTFVEKERWWLAALTCGLAVCLKAYPIALALVLGLLYWRQFSWRWFLGMAALSAAPFLFQSPEYVLKQYYDWFHYGLNARYVEGNFQDVMYFCHRWLVPMSRNEYKVIEVLAGAGVAAVCLLKSRRAQEEKSLRNLVFGVCCGWMMAFGPATEATTYIILAPAAAAAVVMAWSLPNPRWFRLAITIVCVVLSLAQLQLLFPLNKPLHQIAAQPFAALLFIVAVSIHGMGDRLMKPMIGPFKQFDGSSVSRSRRIWRNRGEASQGPSPASNAGGFESLPIV